MHGPMNSPVIKSDSHVVEVSMRMVASLTYILKLRCEGHAIISIKCRSRAPHILTSLLGGGGWSTPDFGIFKPGMSPGTQGMLGWLGSRVVTDRCGEEEI